MNRTAAIDPAYKPLSVDTLAERLSGVEAIAARLGADRSAWRCREVGDGNLNLVFIVEGRAGSLVVKQALPYVRLVGESWPLPLKRAFFEYHALVRQADRDPGRVPEVVHFDEKQACIAMEYLSRHIILRRSFIAGDRVARLSEALGLFMARTLFRGSDLSMDTATRKADLALFAGNIELCDITENLVFSDPYFEVEMNRHTTPQLDGVVAELRADHALKIEAQHLKSAFCSNAETLLHGDLHSGSVMVSRDDVRVIDPEFAVYGPIGFDVGMLIGNLLMAYFGQRGHEAQAGERDTYREWILDQACEVWSVFESEFSRLWRTERTGILYQRTLFEDQGHALAAEAALSQRLAAIWRDTLGFAGVEMHRRILGLAHIAELEEITDEDLRAGCEERALRLGRQLVVNRGALRTMNEICALARAMETEAVT
ncbi:S-methyl-5-thioribose kinase [Nitratireductor sp. GCM10026969]|uniref:S-methyl-5-thioribose kinase n=1 Tax=Nitratireductor sp. GCM10026969 TaxID=3252645 RepID=UPI0036152FAC